MSHGRIRGFRPPVLPLGPKPQQGAGEKARVLPKPNGPVLGPGQHIVLPGRTGLSQLRDHFDARQRPDYDARLKGEASRPDDAKAAAAQQPSQQPSAGLALDALPPAADAMLQRMPLIGGSDAEERADEHGGREPEEELEAEPPFAARTVELHGGLFTLAEGSLDIEQHPLATLEAFLDGDVPFISVAMDLSAIPYGLRLAIPALEARWGRALPFRAVHQTERTAGAALRYLEICASVADPELVRAIDRPLTVTLG